MKRLTRCLAVASALAFVSGAALGVTLPYDEDFSGGIGDWTGSAALNITGDQGADGQDTNFATVADPAGVTTLPISGSPDNVWFLTYAKLTQAANGDLPPTLGTDTAAAFYVTNDGTLRVNDGDTWVDAGSANNVTAGEWTGIAVHIDYAAGWDIYKATGGPGSTLEKLNTAPLAINSGFTGIAAPRSVVIDNAVSFDNVVASLGTATVDGSVASVKIRDEQDGSSSQPIAGRWIAGVVPVHGYTTEGSLVDKLGTELTVGMKNTDRLRFYHDGTEQIYTLSGGFWGQANLKFPAKGETLWRWYAAARDQISFYDGDFHPEVAAAAEFAQSVSVPIAADGWTTRRWTAAGSVTAEAAGLTAAVCPAGSILFTIPAGSFEFDRSEMVGSAWQPPHTLSHGDLIWIQTPVGTAAGLTWTIE
jgi:hypothetical protein